MNRRGFLLQGVGATLAGCTGLTLATPALAKTSDRRVDRLMVHKAGRTLFLVNPDGAFLKRYPIFLGRQPVGRDAPGLKIRGFWNPQQKLGASPGASPRAVPPDLCSSLCGSVARSSGRKHGPSTRSVSNAAIIATPRSRMFLAALTSA